MNVQIEVNGLNRVDFNSPFGWLRNPQVEICGIDDADMCVGNVEKFLKGIEVVPFENLSHYDQFVDEAIEDLENALKLYQEKPGEISVTRTIHVTIRPLHKSSRDATAEQVQQLVDTLEKQGE